MALTQPSTSKIYTTKFQHRWIIANFSYLLKKNSLTFIFSEPFPPKNEEFQFSIRLQPKFIDEKDGNSYVSLYLYLEHCKHINLKTTYRLSILENVDDETGSNAKGKTEIFAVENCRGFSSFISEEDVQELLTLSEDSLTILCQVSIESKEHFKIETEKSSSLFHVNENVITFSQKWIVNGFSTFYYDNIDNNQAYLKLKYSCPSNDEDIKFYAVLMLKKDDGKECPRKYISFYIYLESDFVEEAKVTYRLSILDWKKRFYITAEGQDKFLSNGDGKGAKYFIWCDDLMDLKKGLLPKDKLTVFAQIEISELRSFHNKKMIEETEQIRVNSKNNKMNIEVDLNDEPVINSNCDGFKAHNNELTEPIPIRSAFLVTSGVKKDQNLCRIIDRFQQNQSTHIEHSTLFDRNFMNNLFDYLSKLFAHCNDMATMLSGVLLIEKLYMKGLWDDEIMKLMTLLKDKLLHGQLYLKCYNNGGALPNNVDDFERYQVNWCVRWWMDNLMGRDGVKTELSVIKLSQDRCEARNDNGYVEIMEENDELECFHPVRSSFSVSCGVYYYEVTGITNGEMMFGWSTRETIFEDNVYDKHFIHDRHSIGFNASQKVIWHNSKKIVYPNLPDCVAGDVIGCLIDCDARRFVFYYKGHVMELVDEDEDEHSEDDESDGEVVFEHVVKNSVSKYISFSLSPYYATASLSLHQQCHFNFGQSPLKFVPEDITFRHFHEATGGDGRKYQLNRTFMLYDKIGYLNYWFEHSLVDNQVDLFYCDKMQKKCDDEVKNRSNRYIGQWRLEYDEIEARLECVRYIQSIIEMMWKVIRDDKVDVIAMSIGNVIADLTYLANNEKLLELIYPYFQLRINSPQDAAKHRYICIILSHLIKHSQLFRLDFIKHIRSEVFTYLTRTLTETNDEWTKLFVLIAIDNLKLSEVEKNETKRNAKLNHLLKIDYHQQNVLQILKSTNKFVDYQVYVCAQLYNERTFSTTQLDELNWQTLLNVSDRTNELKLSLDRLSARSDWEWQSVRSTSCDIDYYEVLLLTSGPMRIGWATKRTNLDRTEIGDDQFSIALDGYNRCVWYNKKSFPVRNMSNRWRAGDIVGCRFDKKQRAFYFSLNGQLLSFDCSIYNSSQPYYVAASLYTHQQCYFYLSQFKFNYKLKSSKEASISNSSLINSIINFNSTSTIGDVSFNAGQWTVSNRQLSHQNMITSSSESRTLNEPSIRSPSTECQLCFELTTFKLLRFVCCNTITLCLDCLQQIQACSKCSKQKTTEESSNYAIKGDQHLECRLCCAETPTKLLQFVCCNSLVICLDCLEQFRACPKCKKRVPR